MKTFAVCILDNDNVRADIIKDALMEYGYAPKVFTSEVMALKTMIETSYDVAFVSSDFSNNMPELLMKIRKFSTNTTIIGVLQDSKIDAQLLMSEMDVKHYVHVTENSKEFLMERLCAVEAELMKGDQRKSFVYSALDQAKKLTDKATAKSINTALKILYPSDKEDGRIKGSIGAVPYYEVLRLCAGIYEEGTLEFMNEKERAVLVIKNRNLVSTFITPGTRGLKAFLRIAKWEKGNFYFKNTISVSYPIESDLAYLGIQKLCSLAERSVEWYARMRKNLPSNDININFNLSAIDLKTSYSIPEFEVLCTIIEHEKVMDILNYNTNDDIDIYDSLIGLRKKGAITVQGA